jgi:hypothetical protein
LTRVQRRLGDLLDPGQRVGDQPQIADVVGLEHGLGDLVLADPGGQQLGGQMVRLGSGGLVLEAPGVGDQPGVEGGGDLGVERQVQAAEQLAAEDGAGRRRRVDQVDVAEAGVGGVVVDDQGAGGAPEGVDQAAQAVEGAGVEADEQVGVQGHLVRRDQPVQAGQEAVVAGDHERLREAHHRLAAGGGQGPVQGQRGAEGVAVGMDVAGDHRHLGLGDRVDGGLPVLLRDAHAPGPSWSGPAGV